MIASMIRAEKSASVYLYLALGNLDWRIQALALIELFKAICVFGKLPNNRAVSTGRCNTGLKFTRRSLKAQGLSRALIETQGDLVEMGLRVDGQVRLLRKVLS